MKNLKNRFLFRYKGYYRSVVAIHVKWCAVVGQCRKCGQHWTIVQPLRPHRMDVLFGEEGMHSQHADWRAGVRSVLCLVMMGGRAPAFQCCPQTQHVNNGLWIKMANTLSFVVRGRHFTLSVAQHRKNWKWATLRRWHSELANVRTFSYNLLAERDHTVRVCFASLVVLLQIRIDPEKIVYLLSSWSGPK